MTPKAPKPKTVTFDTTLSATGNNTGIMVPAELLAQLDAGKRPPVLVSINGYEYRNTVGTMAGAAHGQRQRRRAQGNRARSR